MKIAVECTDGLWGQWAARQLEGVAVGAFPASRSVWFGMVAVFTWSADKFEWISREHDTREHGPRALVISRRAASQAHFQTRQFRVRKSAARGHTSSATRLACYLLLFAPSTPRDKCQIRRRPYSNVSNISSSLHILFTIKKYKQQLSHPSLHFLQHFSTFFHWIWHLTFDRLTFFEHFFNFLFLIKKMNKLFKLLVFICLHFLDV